MLKHIGKGNHLTAHTLIGVDEAVVLVIVGRNEVFQMALFSGIIHPQSLNVESLIDREILLRDIGR